MTDQVEPGKGRLTESADPNSTAVNRDLDPASKSPSDARRPLQRRPVVVTMIFVLPYFLLMFGWAMSNPPGSAPDEPDQYVKALGIARLDIGQRYTGPPPEAGPVGIRNASISRTVNIPASLVPTGFACSAFRSTVTASCLPPVAGRKTGSVAYPTTFGAYPPFVYLPIGLVARVANSPYHALLLGRLAVVAMACILLFLGSWHLVRWLGRRALLGAFVGLTPMAIFSGASLSNSGLEISAAFAVACVTVATIRRPDSLRLPQTQATLAVVGGVLILSRQLGVVTFGASILLLLARLGWRPFWDLLRSHRPVFLGTVGVLVACALAIYYWESNYDKPAITGPPWNHDAIGGFSQSTYFILQSAIGVFGWLDTSTPRWTYAAWIVLLVVLVGIAIVLGSVADRWSLIAWMVAMVGVAYVTYATVFFPVGAGLQGRHILPFFMTVPVLAGVVAVEKLSTIEVSSARRLFTLTAVTIPALQAIAMYMNARRYAVGANGPMLFLGKSQWRPEIGWIPSLGVGVVGAFALGLVIAWCRPADRSEDAATVAPPARAELAYVER